VRVASAVIVALCLVLAWFIVRSPAAGRRLAAALSAASTAVILVMTLVPTSRTGVAGCAVQLAAPYLSGGENLANVVLFVPATLFATLATRRPWLVLAAAVAGSVGIEALQAIVTAMGRACDTQDLVNNAAGAAIGVALGALVARLARS
jgi:glycopeptide antibiotics resistance protein